ncbi:MAG TPA: glycosyltransferase, partial [Thermoanaerobaculia bacterium]
LLTNSTLADRSGSELYVRDLAIALRGRGHEPIAYSPILGDVAGDLREATVPVTNDLRSIRVAPDVIHGQHHLEMMTALTHFPGVQAIYVCHGWLPWQEAPPSHPRIRRYVAVDDTVLDRLTIESGIDPALVRTLYNFVDTKRFASRGTPPPKPRNALILNSRATEGNFGALAREACRRHGFDEVDLIGYGSDRPVRHPETLLARYDLVFARARTALEAMVVGCAVVVSDPTGMAGLVTGDNFAELRRRNFGVRALNRAVTVDALAGEIAAYDDAEVSQVSERARSEADIDKVVTAYEELYAEAATRLDVDDREALADYLRWLSLQTKLPGFTDWNRLKERYDALALDAAAMRSRLSSERELQAVTGEVTEAERQMHSDIAALRKRLHRMRRSPASFVFRLLRRR